MVEDGPRVFSPVPGGWGRKGSTRVRLSKWHRTYWKARCEPHGAEKPQSGSWVKHQRSEIKSLRLRGLEHGVSSRTPEAKAHDPRTRVVSRSRHKLPLLHGLHGLAGKIFAGARGNQRRALHATGGIDPHCHPHLDCAVDRIFG